MNNQIILHRETGSVYSQKIMCVLGCNKTKWQSVMAGVGMPRAEQEILVVSFARRMPILQIGADLYCDTDMIMNTLSEKLNQPSLSRFNLSEVENQAIWEFDSELFYAVQGCVSKLKFMRSFIKNIGLSKAMCFIKDRLTMPNAKQASALITHKKQSEWKAIVEQYFTKMNHQLDNSLFLSGKASPNAVDFSAFTQIFYMIFLDSKCLQNYPKLKLWSERMTAFGLGNFVEITAEKALETAKNTEPLPISDTLKKSKRLGQEIEVPFNDELGKLVVKPLKGILVGEDDYKYIVKRENETVGTVHIHIPKQCFGACG